MSIPSPLRTRPGPRGAYGNRILAALPANDYERLRPALEPVALPLGLSIHGPGELERHLYFVTEGVVSRYYLTEHAESAEYALAGREGVIGIASFLGGESAPNRAVVVQRRLRISAGGGPGAGRIQSRLPAVAVAFALHPGAGHPDRADRGVQPAPCRGSAALPLDPLVPGPGALARPDGDAGADRHFTRRAPRRRDGGRFEAATGRIDSLPPRPYRRAGSPGIGGAGLRVLLGRQAGV